MTWRTCTIVLATAVSAHAGPAVRDAAGAWRPEGVRIAAAISPTRVTVGDRILYTLTVSAPADVSVTPPAVGDRAGDFRVRHLGRRDAKGGVSFLYDLGVYETGQRFIPSANVTLRDARGQKAHIGVGAVAVTVESVLDRDAKDIRDIKPPLELSYSSAGVVAWILILCGAAAALTILLIRRRRAGESSAPPPSPPHVIALGELERLLAMNLIAAGHIKEYYIRLSDIARRYIEGRFRLRAPDRTTEEFLAEAGASGMLDARARTLVGDFLEQCDMVKFARYGPTDEEIQGAYAAAKRFVLETAAHAEG